MHHLREERLLLLIGHLHVGMDLLHVLLDFWHQLFIARGFQVFAAGTVNRAHVMPLSGGIAATQSDTRWDACWQPEEYAALPHGEYTRNAT